jgi:guanylate kinase
VAVGRAKADEIVSTVSALRRRNGLLIIVSAPSGTGKTTVCDALLADMPELRRSVSFTTRPPRKGEREGEHYHFVANEQFKRELDRGNFVEWAEVHGNLYGTPRDFIDRRMRASKDTVLVIDVQGARSIKNLFPEAVLIFLLPPSLAELKRRLKMRAYGRNEDVGLRLRNALAEFSCYPTYDYLVVNDDVAKAASVLRGIIMAERHRANRLRLPADPDTKTR